LRLQILKRGLVDIADKNARAVRDERFRDRAPYSARARRHEDALAFRCGHEFLDVFIRRPRG